MVIYTLKKLKQITIFRQSLSRDRSKKRGGFGAAPVTLPHKKFRNHKCDIAFLRLEDPGNQVPRHYKARFERG